MPCCSQGSKGEGGIWYRKSDTPAEETLGGQKGKKKKNEKKKSSVEQQAPT